MASNMDHVTSQIIRSMRPIGLIAFLGLVSGMSAMMTFHLRGQRQYYQLLGIGLVVFEVIMAVICFIKLLLLRPPTYHKNGYIPDHLC